MKAFHAIVAGEVQGVGFRYSATREARSLALCGWVRNTAEGEVEVWAEGEEDSLLAFSGWLREGPPYAVVSDLRLTWESPLGIYSSFNVGF